MDWTKRATNDTEAISMIYDLYEYTILLQIQIEEYLKTSK